MTQLDNNVLSRNISVNFLISGSNENAVTDLYDPGLNDSR